MKNKTQLSTKVLMTLASGLILLAQGCKTPSTTVEPIEPSPAVAPVGPTTTAMAPPGFSEGRVDTELYTLYKRVPSKVAVGETFEYTYTITSKAKLADVTVMDAVPAGTTVVSSDPQASVQGNNLVWTYPSLEAGETKTIRVKVRATQVGFLRNCARITAVPVACTEVEVGQPKISIVKSGPASAKVGEAIAFNVTIRNEGNYPASGVVVTDTLPAGLTHASGSNSVTFDVGTLEAGGSRDFTVPVTAAARGRHCNTAKVTTTNAGEADAEACVIVVQPGLAITKEGPPLQFAGKTAEYTIVVSNTGDTELTNVVVTDTAPAATRLLSAPGGQISGNSATWTIPSIASGDQKQLSVVLTTMNIGTHCNNVVATASGDGLSANAQACTEWRGSPAILLEVIDTVDPLLKGEKTTYIIRVTNQGTALDRNIAISARFPAGINPISATGPTANQISGKVVSFGAVPVLQPKEVVEFQIVGDALDTPGDQRLNVELKSDLLKTPVKEEESTHIY